MLRDPKAAVGEPRAATDFELIARAQAGEVDAFALLYDRHAAVVLALARRIVASHGDAQDVLHDVFIEAWQHVREFDPARASVRTWLLVRMRSRALDRLERRGREQKLYRALWPGERSSASQAPEREYALREALAELDDGVRDALELTYFFGLTASEISERMQVPEGTVRSRLARGLSRLEHTLGTLKGSSHE